MVLYLVWSCAGEHEQEEHDCFSYDGSRDILLRKLSTKEWRKRKWSIVKTELVSKTMSISLSCTSEIPQLWRRFLTVQALYCRMIGDLSTRGDSRSSPRFQ